MSYGNISLGSSGFGRSGPGLQAEGLEADPYTLQVGPPTKVKNQKNK